MEIVTAVFATVVAAFCFFAIVSKDLRDRNTVDEKNTSE